MALTCRSQAVLQQCKKRETVKLVHFNRGLSTEGLNVIERAVPVATLSFAKAVCMLSCRLVRQLRTTRMAAHAASGPTIPDKLDRDAFRTQLTVPALRVPKQKCHELMKKFRGFTLDRPKLRCIVQDGTREDTKLLLLEAKVDVTGLSPELQELISSCGLESCSCDVTIDYSHLSADQVLKKLLPEGIDCPSSFETVGHIAHLNLRDEQLSYKHLIGQVLLDKNPHIRTVVNKVGAIENEFRVFQMEVLAGEQQLETEVVQHGMRFRLDFSQVYWNSRLEAEHHRLVSQFSPDHVICDIMAGIGPFAVPAAQHGCTVYANDLNPRSVHYMALNARINRLDKLIKVFNMDGREFVRLLCATPGGPAGSWMQQQQQEQQQQQQEAGADTSGQDQQQQTGSAAAEASTATQQAPAQPGASAAPKRKSKPQRREQQPDEPVPPIPRDFLLPPQGVIFQHAIMNLPASAVEFLDAFNGAFDPELWEGRLPLVHCYTFKRAAETEQDIVNKVEHYLGGKLDEPPSIHYVRDVAPNKLMLCVSFRVPVGVAFNGRQQADKSEGEGQSKRRRMEESGQ